MGSPKPPQEEGRGRAPFYLGIKFQVFKIENFGYETLMGVDEMFSTNSKVFVRHALILENS